MPKVTEKQLWSISDGAIIDADIPSPFTMRQFTIEGGENELLWVVFDGEGKVLFSTVELLSANSYRKGFLAGYAAGLAVKNGDPNLPLD
jgi:hypothetical protein